MNIRNNTDRALTVPLPRGKKLHLGPRQSGQISSKSAAHPKFQALVEAGDVEILDGGRNDTVGGVGPDSAQAPSRTRGLK